MGKKKIFVYLFGSSIGTLILSFPFRFMENWMMGILQERIQENWQTLFTFVTIWILPLLVSVGLIYLGYRMAGKKALRNQFYLKFEGYDEKLLSSSPSPFKGATSFKLTISNQENVPRSVSRFMLEIELENGDKKELPPMNTDGKTEANITLYLQPHESKIVQLNFVYEVKPIQGSGKLLYVFDDLGAWCRVPINVDTMVTMAKKSSSRSGDYQPV